MKRYLLFTGTTDKSSSPIGGFDDFCADADNLTELQEFYLTTHEADSLNWAHIADLETKEVVSELIYATRRWA